MPSRSYPNFLDPVAVDSGFSSPPHHPAHLPRIMVDPAILSSAAATTDSPLTSLSLLSQRRIIVSHHLPLRASPDPTAPSSWSFSYNPDTLVLQFRSDLPLGIEVLHVGTLCSLPDSLDPAYHDAVAAHLRREFHCVPVLLPQTSTPASTMASTNTTSGPSTTSSPSPPPPSAASASISPSSAPISPLTSSLPITFPRSSTPTTTSFASRTTTFLPSPPSFASASPGQS